MCELKRVHAADFRAVLMVVLVSRSDAVDDGDALGRRFHIPQDDLAVGRTRGVDHTLKLEAREYVR